jgi:asparagine synthase (glutamine-hydrolysing)
MSAQAGVWNSDGRPIELQLLKDFSNSLKLQGPDGEFSYVEGSVALLYRPFHTTIESRRERQPHVSRKGFVVTWDGRLDNREDLIAELQGHLDVEPTDVDIVAAAFDRWETRCFGRMVGDWALSVWKPARRELVLACDFMAIRHIFYHVKNERVWWATDISPIVSLSGDTFRIDEDYVAGYFALYPEGHLTPYRSIREVPPGHFVRIRDGQTTVDRYWQFLTKSRIRYKTDGEYEDHFRHIYWQSLRRRLRSDSPILAELSGGLDSSSIVCVADEILAKEQGYTPRLDTLSYTDLTEPNGDDAVYRERVERTRGRRGVHIDVSSFGESDSFDYLDFVPLPGYLGVGRTMEARRYDAILSGGYRVVLSGVGGDEFLGGVPSPAAQLADLLVQLRLGALARQLMAWSLLKRQPWIQLMRDAVLTLLPATLAQHWSEDAEIEPWLDKSFARRTRIAVRQLDVKEHFGLWLPTRRSCASAVQMIANKMSKRIASRIGVEEIRYPYLDQDLIEFVFSIPASQLLRPGERRSLMRRALVRTVPQEILSRRSKQVGARTPLRALQRNWHCLETAFQHPLISSLGFVNPGRFRERLLDARNGKEIHIARILKAISLEFWLRDVIRRKVVGVLNAPARNGTLARACANT